MERELEGFEALAPAGKDQIEWMRTLYYKKLHSPEPDGKLDRELVSMVLDHARRVIAHPSRPTYQLLENFSRFPMSEIALDESLEENPFLNDVDQLLVELAVEKPFSCVAMLDCSSSMAGEKHILSCVSIAVLLLEVASRDTSVITFASGASTVKELLVDEPSEATLLKFLRKQPRGFTNICRGLEEGLAQLKKQGSRKRKIGLIATDGRSTEGGDPLEAASQYDFLVVLHLHGPGSHLEASREIAQRGHGICLEVERFEELPHRLYDALRLLARR